MGTITEQDIDIAHRAPTNAWHLYVGRDICGNVEEGLNHEWLVTNGLGGYASGSLVGATTRSYHGLLVAATRPPVERTVLVTKTDETVKLPDGQTLNLGTNEYQNSTIDPQGYHYLDTVALEGDILCFTYRLGELLTLQKRIWMEYGQNTTYVQYTLHGIFDETSEKSEEKLTLIVSPYCLCRDHHSITRGSSGWRFLVDNHGNKCSVQAYDGATPVTMIAGPSAFFTPTGWWYWNILHRRERERGLPDIEDVYQPGNFRMQLVPGMHVTLVLSSESDLPADLGGELHEDAIAHALLRHNRRIRQLLTVTERTTANLPLKDPVLARLAVAADQFIVARPEQSSSMAIGKENIRLTPERKTIIAGYPWFTDWGRDSMISLPGLLLTTGRYSEARGLLKAFAAFTQNGLIPNRFPDHGEAPEYNTADATLWMFHALDSYLAVTRDWTLLKELYPTMSDIIAWHVRGTSYNIGIDTRDGLLHQGAPDLQLTWMDAKVDDWVVTPRRGKAVEINALWYRALTAIESWAVRLWTDATQYSQLRTQVRQNFAARFWYKDGGYLYDVVDVDGVPGQNDASLRPNQLLAGSLTRDLLSEQQLSSMLQQVTNHLLTPLGLRSLSPDDPHYHTHFNGKREERDTAYHQGAVWLWLIGPYIDVHRRVHNDRNAMHALLEPFIAHLWKTCLGTLSEVTDPESPFTPGGCFAQAWSVAEVLRRWHLIAE